jgi:hypothetical protein
MVDTAGKAKLIAEKKDVPKACGLPGDIIGVTNNDEDDRANPGGSSASGGAVEGDTGKGKDYYVMSFDSRLIGEKGCLPDYIRNQFPCSVSHRGALDRTALDLITINAGSGVAFKASSESLAELQALNGYRIMGNYYETASHLNSQPGSEC